MTKPATTDEAADTGTDSSRKWLYAWMMFGILLAAYFFVYFHRMSVNIVGPDIIIDVGGNVGFLSSAYFWTYTAMQIPSGLLSDRFGPRKTSASLLMVAALGSFLTYAGTDFNTIVLGKILIAAGMAAVYIPMMKVVAVWFPKEYFPQLTGIIIAVGNIGAIAASVPLEEIANAIGWRDTFFFLGLVTVALAVLCGLLIRDGGVKRSEKGATAKVLRGLMEVFSGGRKFWPMALAYFFVYGTIMVFQGTYSKSYFNTAYDFAWGVAWLIAMIGIGKVVSTVLIGILAGRGITKSKRSVMLYGTIGYAAVWAVLWMFTGQLGAFWFWFAVCTLFGFLGGFMSLSFTQVKEWYPVSMAGTSVSAMNVFLFLGASVSTTLAGLLVKKSSVTGTYAVSDFGLLWGVMFLFSVLAVICVYLSVEKMDGAA